MSGVRTPQCRTPTPRISQPLSTGRLGMANGQRPLAEMEVTTSPPLPPTRPLHTRPSTAGPHPPPDLHRCYHTLPIPAPISFPPSYTHPHPLPRRYAENPSWCRMPYFCRMPCYFQTTGYCKMSCRLTMNRFFSLPTHPLPLPLYLYVGCCCMLGRTLQGLWVVPYTGWSPPTKGAGIQGTRGMANTAR